MSMKLMPGTKLPEVTLTLTTGEAYTPGRLEEGWELFIIYRGKHCPRCKTYLNKLESLKSDFEAINVSIYIATADPKEKVEDDLAEFGWSMPVAYGMTKEQIQYLGLYMSTHADGRPFAEPGLFVINPESTIQVMGIANAASCRPDLDVILDGIKGIQSRGLPIFGMEQ